MNQTPSPCASSAEVNALDPSGLPDVSWYNKLKRENITQIIPNCHNTMKNISVTKIPNALKD
jgi:hypothetical protein